MSELIIKGQKAKRASLELAMLSSKDKDDALKVISLNLIKYSKEIITANNQDVELAKTNSVKKTLIDRLILNEERIKNMSEGIDQIVSLSDPVGEVSSMKKRPNGLIIGKKKVPLGVIGIIYEARPNVTVDAFGLCFKTGNVVILRGGKEAINSNKAIVDILQLSLNECGITKDAVQIVNDISRETAVEMMKLNEYLDVLIPRGGSGLIQSVIKNSTVPVIETGVGNCHIYVDEYAKFDMALDTIINAKTQRPCVCNACESLVINKKIANDFLPLICDDLKKNNVEIRGDKLTCEIIGNINEASETDYYEEYLDYIISIKVVNNIDEAIEHINEHNTKHSEAIITENYTNAQKFLDTIDAAAVYVNASTRFTDGFEFGFGAEIGISTQKLHARGPMGLEELTTTKYIIYGNGQVRK